MSLKTEGVKRAAAKMIFYYISTLISVGDEDPRRTVATELGEMIDLSKEQVEYVLYTLDKNNDSLFLKDLDTIISLIESNDKESIAIALQMITKIRNDAKEAFDELKLEAEHDGKEDEDNKEKEVNADG